MSAKSFLPPFLQRMCWPITANLSPAERVDFVRHLWPDLNWWATDPEVTDGHMIVEEPS